MTNLDRPRYVLKVGVAAWAVCGAIAAMRDQPWWAALCLFSVMVGLFTLVYSRPSE